MNTETLDILKENALKAYTDGSTSDKQLLTRLFGGKTFAKDATEYVFTFEEVCREAGVNPEDYKVVSGMHEEEKASVYSQKMRLIYKVCNGDWKADFSNKEAKWYPWFEYKPGIGFVLADVIYLYASTSVSARLCAKNEAIIRHICKYFLKEYNDYLLS